mmetsp:Transcript_9873/g.17291  ORF Transcript_9873/g.17291 Transcript_9873/m.17291 type:complete len:242 (+) Transcript_9873:110-835(+)
MNTTADTTANAAATNPYTDFQAGVTAALRSWSALRTAVEQSWGGTHSSSKAEDLRSNIFAYFDGSSPNPKMKLEELEDNLSAYMEEEFGVVLEDESERQLADLIWRMYEDCGRGDVRLAREVVSNAVKAAEVLEKSHVKSVIQSGQDGDDDDDMDDDDDSDAEGNAGAQQQGMQGMGDATNDNNNVALSYASETLFGGPPKPKKELPPPRQLGEPEPEKPQPALDDDGFAPVVTKKKGKKR